jgi:MYXO-CTERM domain-containing protein
MNTHISTAKQATTPTHRLQLTGYLTGAIGTASLLAAPQTEAAVTAVTFGFGSVLNASDGSHYFSVSGAGSLAAAAGSSYVRIGGLFSKSVGSVYETASFNAHYGLPSFFTAGTVIGSGTNGALGYSYFQAANPVVDLTSDQLNKNIGFKTSANNFGWANVSWNEAAKALTINSAYVETVANTPITITAAPEPSRALLALAGLGGVALRRRRKHAA